MAVVDLDLPEIFEEAFEMAGESFQSGYDIRQARRSLNFVMDEWANRGLNLWTVEEGTIPCVSGTSTYALPTDTVDIIEQVIRSTDGLTDYNLRRITVSEFGSLSKKSQSSRPTSIWVQRLTAPQVTLWPVPDDTYTLVYWRLRRLEGLSTGISGNTDLPSRFRPALAAGMAVRIARLRGKLNLIADLNGEYEKQFRLASEEDRDRAPLRLVPYVGR